MRPPTAERSTRLDGLTALRFFAALAVVLCHFASFMNLSGVPAAVLLFGQFGVDFFFVLSGFVLTWSWKPQRSTLRFYWLRFARIWPVHLAVLAAIFVSGTRGPLGNTIEEVFLVQQWTPTTAWRVGLNGVTWTLSVEVLFYLLFPFLIRPTAKLGSRTLALFAVGGWLLAGAWYMAAKHLMSGSVIWAAATNPYVRLPQFFVGMAIALLVKRHALAAPARTAALLKAAGGIGIATVWAVFVLSQHDQYDSTLIPRWTFLVTPGMALLVAGFALAGQRSGGTTPRWLVALGEWSFALYLIHHALIGGLVNHLNGIPNLAAAVTLTLLSVALSGVVYVFFERPVERWLRMRGPREAAHSAPL